MSSRFVLALAGGLTAIAILIGVVFYARRGDHLAPTGQILKFRSVPADEQRSIAVLDLRISNDSDIAMEVRDIALNLQIKDGREFEGSLVAGASARQIFQYYPALGELYNEPLVRGSRIPPHTTADRMLVARLDVPEQELANRGKLTVEVQDRSFLKLELLEKPR